MTTRRPLKTSEMTKETNKASNTAPAGLPLAFGRCPKGGVWNGGPGCIGYPGCTGGCPWGTGDGPEYIGGCPGTGGGPACIGGCAGTDGGPNPGACCGGAGWLYGFGWCCGGCGGCGGGWNGGWLMIPRGGN